MIEEIVMFWSLGESYGTMYQLEAKSSALQINILTYVNFEVNFFTVEEIVRG